MRADIETKAGKGVDIAELAIRCLDEAIDRLAAQKKDVERRLVDLKAENSLLEDEIRNNIKSGRRLLYGDDEGDEVNLDDVEALVSTLNSSTHELGQFLDVITKRMTVLDKNRELELLLENLRGNLSDSINGLANLKPLLLNRDRDVDLNEIDKLKATTRQKILGTSAIIRSQEMERQRIAREIHDGPAQAIANVVLRLDIVNKMYEKNPSSVPEELNKMKELAQHALNEIRGFIFELRPMTLQDLGLSATIKRFINTMANPDSTQIQFIREGDEREIDPDVKLAVFRIAQESLNNMRKHSNAKECWVHLKYFRDKVILIVEDDGGGFDKSTAVDSQKRYVSFGILGMHERADDIGASLDISSKLGGGTKMTLVVMDKKETSKG